MKIRRIIEFRNEGPHKKTSWYSKQKIVNDLDRFCEKEKFSRSEVINSLLVDFLEKEGYRPRRKENE